MRISFFILLILLCCPLYGQGKTYYHDVPVKDIRRQHQIDMKETKDVVPDSNSKEKELVDETWNSPYVNPYKETSDISKVLEFEEYCFPLDHLRKSSSFGMRALFQRMHKGIDFAIPLGTPVYVSSNGKVRITGYEKSGYGKYIVVRHPNGIETVYAHLSKIIVSRNENVRVGQVIAFSGNTGRSTGPHLHYEMRYRGIAFDPENMISISKREITSFLFTSAVSKRRVQKVHYKIVRAHVEGNCKQVADNLDVPVEFFCEINGFDTDARIKKGQLVRIPNR